ncbi:phage tail protein [Pseudovibrio sp. Tun.PSC04-5.I4]|uniref:phage tail protein n=2 Tax=Pseudovibrio sp. Tun.PSC04-5.I4 TaxID=1798213 RepID=UPI00088ABC74|nr:phage tail protein [Pseudovibrio sp. Tun.PSC04-5.I4]SDR15548.1 hypothetical protein SAMN04515695_3059 [Pseudovibrio sp. Tun.PSC04-5.I4]
MAERIFGPEIVDANEDGVLVRELKAATAFLIGTAPIHEVHKTSQEQVKYINKPILIRREADITKHFGPTRDGYTLPQKLRAMFKQAKTRGLGTICVVNVFDPATHKDDADKPDPSKVTGLDIIGAFDAMGRPSGLKLAYSCYQRFGWFPKNILAPGYDGLAGVRSEMEAICGRIRARCYWDAPFGVTLQQLQEARGPEGSFDFQTNDTRVNLCWPMMETVNLDEMSDTAGEVVADHYSAYLVGVVLMSVMEYGYHHSPSNRPIKGIEGAAQDVLYVPGDGSSDTQVTRSNGIISCEERFGKGPHTSGNRNAGYPTKTTMLTFFHAQYTQDVLDEAILHFLDEKKDRNGSLARIEQVEDAINAWGIGKTKGNDPELSGFRFAFDREKMSPAFAADGWYHYALEFAPVGIMETISVRRSLNINLLADALGLSQSEAA